MDINNKSCKTKKYIICFLFIIYMIILFQLTIFRFSIPIVSPISITYSVEARFYYANFIPGRSFLRFWGDIFSHNGKYLAAIINLAGNLIAFMPFGFLLPYIFPRLKKWYFIMPLAFILTSVIECVQLLTGFGIFDVDDIIENTIGAMLGFLLNCAVTRLMCKKKSADIK